MALCLGATDDARLHTLSGLLRAAFTALPPFDLAKAAADRDRWLHGRRSASVATVQSAPAWRELARKVKRRIEIIDTSPVRLSHGAWKDRTNNPTN